MNQPSNNNMFILFATFTLFSGGGVVRLSTFKRAKKKLARNNWEREINQQSETSSVEAVENLEIITQNKTNLKLIGIKGGKISIINMPGAPEAVPECLASLSSVRSVVVWKGYYVVVLRNALAIYDIDTCALVYSARLSQNENSCGAKKYNLYQEAVKLAGDFLYCRVDSYWTVPENGTVKVDERGSDVSFSSRSNSIEFNPPHIRDSSSSSSMTIDHSEVNVQQERSQRERSHRCSSEGRMSSRRSDESMKLRLPLDSDARKQLEVSKREDLDDSIDEERQPLQLPVSKANLLRKAKHIKEDQKSIKSVSFTGEVEASMESSIDSSESLSSVRSRGRNPGQARRISLSMENDGNSLISHTDSDGESTGQDSFKLVRINLTLAVQEELKNTNLWEELAHDVTAFDVCPGSPQTYYAFTLKGDIIRDKKTLYTRQENHPVNYYNCIGSRNNYLTTGEYSEEPTIKNIVTLFSTEGSKLDKYAFENHKVNSNSEICTVSMFTQKRLNFIMVCTTEFSIRLLAAYCKKLQCICTGISTKRQGRSQLTGCRAVSISPSRTDILACSDFAFILRLSVSF